MNGEMLDPVVDALILPRAERDRIMWHLRDALPNEGVGLLAVAWSEHGGRRIAETRRFYPGINVRASPVRFELDPHALVAAMRDMDRHGWSLGAIVHSHPLGPASPSRTDLAEAFYPDALMLIASFPSDPPDLQAWRLEQGDGDFIPHRVPIRTAKDDATSPTES